MNIITTPIFYINSKPHIGHFYSVLLADAIKKSIQLQSKTHYLSTKLTTGTDEHGLKVLQSAMKENLEIKTYCNLYSNYFKKSAHLAQADYNDFIRTTEERHINIVQILWKKLYENTGFIKKSTYSGYYSVSDESFIPNKDLIFDEENNMYKTSEGKSVEYLSEDSYTFQVNEELLTKYNNLINTKQLKLNKILQNEMNEYIKVKLFDFSLSRPSRRVSWGITVPNDPNYIIYVWFDALLNYITSAVYYNHNNEQITFPLIKQIINQINFVHVIGKDITKFHGYLFPLVLLALDIFPKEMSIVSHNHFLVNNNKMSKSLNNSIHSESLIKKCSYDAVRYYFLTNGPFDKDVSLVESQINKIYYSEIPDMFVNLVMRMSNKKLFNANDYSSKKNFAYINEEIKSLIAENTELIIKIKRLYSNFEFGLVALNLNKIMLSLNKFIHRSEFWKIKENEKLKEIIIFTIETMRIWTVLIYPILPSLSLNFMSIINGGDNATVSNIENQTNEICITFDMASYEYDNGTEYFFFYDYGKVKSIFVRKELY